MIPFAKLTEPEFKAAIAAKLTGREWLVFLAVKLIAHSGHTVKRRDIERITRLGARHVKLHLRNLERNGLLKRVFGGARQDPWGVFRVQFPYAAGIAHDPSTGIALDPSSRDKRDRPRSLYTIQGSDLDLAKGSDPSFLPVGVQGERTNERLDRLAKLARELYPSMARAPAKKYVQRLLELNTRVTVEEFEHFMRHAATDPTVAMADIPLAVICTRDRWETWELRRRAARRREPTPLRAPSREDQISKAELENFLRELR